jgi:hypothetical protein
MKRSVWKVALPFQEWLDGFTDLSGRREHFEHVIA